MTAPTPAEILPRPWAGIEPPAEHCTAPGCTTTDTATVDGRWGRRCAEHPPTFDPTYAVHLAVRLGPEAAFTYCRTDLPL